MEMQRYWFGCIVIIGILLFCYLIVSLSVRILYLVLYRKYDIKLKIGRISFLSVQGIYLHLKNGTTLEIEKIWISSRLCHMNFKSLFALCINDIRLQGNSEWITSRSRKVNSDPKSSKSVAIRFLTWLFLKLLSSQLFSIYFFNASVMQLGKLEEEFLIHVSTKKLAVYCSANTKHMEINGSIASAFLKVYKHSPLNAEQTKTESCLLNVSVIITLKVDIRPNQKLEIQSFSLYVKQPELILHEGFSISKLKRQVSGGLGEKNTEVVNSDLMPVNGAESKNSIPDSQPRQSLLSKFPSEMYLLIESFSVKLMKEGGYRAFTLNVKSVETEFKRNEMLDSLSILPTQFTFCILDVHAATGHVQFAQLFKAEARLEVENKIVNSKFNLSSLIFSYDKDALQYWLGAINSSKEKKIQHKRKLRSNSYDGVIEFLNNFHFQNITEFDNICISMKLPSCNAFSLGLTHLRLSYRDSQAALLDDAAVKPFADRHFSCEFLLETCYLKLGEETLADSTALKRNHFWNIPFSVGMILLKTRFHLEDFTAECLMDTLHFEWSPNLSKLVKDVQKCVKDSTPKLVEEDIPEYHPVKNSDTVSSSIIRTLRGKKCSLQVNLCSINVFLLSEIKTAIVGRFDYSSVEYRGERIKASIEGCKLSTISISAPNYSCIKCADMKSFLCHITQSSVIYDPSKQEIRLEMFRDVYTMWNTSFHMAFLNVIEDMKDLKAVISNNQNNYSENLSKGDRQIGKTFYIKLQGNVHIGLRLSSSHRVVFSSPEVAATFNQHIQTAETNLLTVNFDDNEIFNFKQFQIQLAPGTEQDIYNRRTFEDLELSNNRLLCMFVDEFHLVFPHNYNFAEAFTEEFSGVIKWLKQVHKKKKVPFTLETRLPPDVSIKAKIWTIEVQDDPFEVKLRDNFELLEDEYHESLKRQKMLDEEIESFQRKRLVPAEKINELYFKLSKKNSEIYILRSKQLYQYSPMRKSLVVWQLDDVEIFAVADLSYHGTERVVNHMKKLDAESPFPEEGLEFNTLWARKVRCSTSCWSCTLRDFPQPLLMIKGLHAWGFLIGAEQDGPPRAKRSSVIEIGEPWSNATVERNMPSLKYYHDLTFDMEEMCMSYGPCWEPPMAQVGLSMEYVSRPSLDPSPALPWWDKMRLLYHGRLTFSIQHLTLLMRASLDPYNNTELMELTWTDVIIDWTTGKIITKGDLDMYVHTASKYDDCRVLHIPSLKLSISLDWLCLGNPYDHHNIVPCAPDKIPEYSINQVHDSYRAFRSQNLNISYSFESKYVNTETKDYPAMLLYSSTLRWIENLKMILSGVTRLTRRGKLFNNVKPRKPQLNRHYRNLRVSLNLPKFQIFYWMSFAKRQGLELVGGRLALSSENTLSLVAVNDHLNHRPRASWSIGYLNCELCDSEIWLYDWMQTNINESTADSFHTPVEKSYFLSVNRVSYGREEIVKNVVSDVDKPDTPTHRLVVYGLKGAWTKHNRNVVFGLYDSYMKNILLKKNLSTEALRGFKVETQNTPQKLRSQTNASQNAAQSPISHLQSGHAVSMLQKLIAEAEANPMVFTEELEGSTREQVLHGVAACQTDDVLQKKWLIELVNSQVMLRGCETSGYVIVSAAKAQILQRIHMPVWKDRSLVSKTTWVGSFECMQYYATVDPGSTGVLSMDNVMWLSVDNIDGRDSALICDLPDLVGSGHSVGGVVSNTVGAASDPSTGSIQLQRIVSRCGCQFFYASYGENVDTSNLDEVPPLPDNIDIWEPEVAVDSFTLTHHDLEICTNSLQYAMILDLVNNLLLYVEPRKKEAIEKLQYMRFQLQIRSVDDQKEPILQIQEKVRSLVSKLRRLEKDAYNTHRLYLENPEKEMYLERLQQIENNIYNCKERLNTMNEELTTMICCFKETQIIACKSRQRSTSQDKGICVARRAEVCFKHALWRLTDADGLLGIADLVLSNFLYSKVTKSDDSVEHLLEVGYVKVINLLPNQLYKHVLHPTDVQTSIPLDRQCMLRIYCRERAPVGGISVKEHLEVNVIPLAIGLTDAFFKTMLKFFFPGRDTDKDDRREEEHETFSHKKKDLMQKRSSTFYSDREDIEKMKERADKNHTFFYIKIPEVPLRVSYKGKKEKNIEDVENLSLVLTTLEYHNKTWTWLDLLMELKNDAKKVLLSQAIREKIRLTKRRGSPERDSEPQEEEKATLLFGPKLLPGPERSSKRNIFRRPRKE